MSEINGLASIIGDVRTLHGIAAPPDRLDFPSQAAYAQAVHEWWTDTHCWKVTRVSLDAQ